MNNALLDTDTLSEIGKGVNQTVIRNAVAYRRAFGHYTLSSVSVMEIISGHQRNQSAKRIAGFLASIAPEEVVHFDKAAGELAGRIAGDLIRTGQPIGLADTMIAAIALTNGLELVTGNTTHFARLRPLGYPLMLVNWRF